MRPSPRLSSLALLALAAAAPGVAAAQQDRDRDRDRVRPGDAHRIDTTVTVGRGGSVDLGLISGDITVTAWNRDQVQVRAESEVIPLRFEQVGSTVRVRTVSGQYRRSGEQRMEVVVPVGTRVEAGSVSGSVSVRGVRGEVEASSVSADVVVENATRRATINSVSGSVRGTAIEGDVRARSVSGDVQLADVTGEVDAESVSGEITIRDARSSRVSAATVSGEVEYRGTIDRSGTYDFKSHSGDVRLVVPADAAATLTTQTFSGSVRSDFAMTMGPTDSRARNRRMEFTINGGGARISARTFSGTVSVERVGGRGADRE